MPGVGEYFKFDWMLGYAGLAHQQVLHTGSDHWGAIKVVSDSEVYVYDSNFIELTYRTLKQIASIANSCSAQITLKECKSIFVAMSVPLHF